MLLDFSICISVPYCKGVKSDTSLTKAGRGEHFGGGTGEGAVRGGGGEGRFPAALMKNQ